jgi:FkbM family methyltransferase
MINILDVGAAIGERPPYQPLIDAGCARMIGFEPNSVECERLNKAFGPPHRFFPKFIGDGKPATFHETNWALTGSLFAPNSRLLEKFQNLSELVTPVAKHAVETTRLDDLSEINDVDFFKIDVQGSELAVFENAKRILSDTLVIDTEVEFVELYQGQPLFADIDIFLRRQGFQFHTFNGFGMRGFKPLINTSTSHQGFRQFLWSDAIYVRDWMVLDELSEIKLQKYAVLAHDLLASYDLAHHVLVALDKKTGGNVASAYLTRLCGSAGCDTRESNSIERDADSLIEQGNAFEDEGFNAQALECYEAAIRLVPSMARAHLNRGNILLETGDSDGALASYAKAIFFSPSYAAAHYNTGNVYLRSDRIKAALAAYDKAIALKPDFVDAIVARSNVLKDLERLDEANSSALSEASFCLPDMVSVPIVNDVFVTVPASLKYMTTFVLQEQGDWFEDEIKFVRHLMQPGMKVVDIGANYGVYSLSIAKIVGDNGMVWAFEPTEATANCLSNSILKNKFGNIELIRAGLSGRCGEAPFFTSPNSELNSLTQAATSSEQFETINLLTLDFCSKKYGWDLVDFIKLDAEGEEVNILKGGHEFLSSASPLIMYELKHGAGINLPLVGAFKEMGYDSYRLLPALNILVPFDQNEAFDDFLLNLFACKQDRATRLEQDGVLVKKWQEKLNSNSSNTKAFFERSVFGKIQKKYTKISGEIDSEIYSRTVDSYLMAVSEVEASADKVGYLMGALSSMLRMVSHEEQSDVRLIAFSRIAFASGERALGVNILSNLIDKYFLGNDFKISGPCLPAMEKYDRIGPGGRQKDWLVSSVIEQYLCKSAFSLYFSGQAALPLFSELKKLCFFDESMESRYLLLQSRLLH